MEPQAGPRWRNPRPSSLLSNFCNHPKKPTTNNSHHPQISSPSGHLRHAHEVTIQTRPSLLVHLSLPTMSEFSNIPLVAHQFSLVMHTAVDFGHEQGIGIGIIQRAAIGAVQTSTLPMEEHKHGIEGTRDRKKTDCKISLLLQRAVDEAR